LPVTTIPCPDAEVLRRLLLGELAPADLEPLGDHVLSCERCGDALNRLHPNDPLLQTLRGGDTATSLPPLVQSLIARLSIPPAGTAGDKTVASLGESPPPPVDELVSRWESLRKQGQVMSAEELCAGRPELLPEVRQRLDALGDMERLLATGAPESTPSHTDAEADAHTSAAAAALRPPQAPDELGRLGGYRILKLLGQGGMGAVFLAEDPHLERHIALKVMGPGLAAKPEARRHFLREAKATAKLKNDHVVSIYQVGEDNGVPFLAMEYLEGESLDSRLRRSEKMPLTELLRIAREITQGLAAAHAKGLVHRDIKPANIWLENSGQGPGARGQENETESRSLQAPDPWPLAPTRVKILDFGLARGGVEEVQITQSGAILGTPAYMSPEQGRGETADARSDLFSLGCVLYRLCAGKAPFEGPTVMAVLTALATQDPAPVSQFNRDLPEALAGLVTRLLAKRPDDRPASAQAVLDELQAIERQRAQESQTLALPPKASPAVAALPTPTPEPPANKQTQVQPRPPRRWVKVEAALLGVAAIIGLGGVIIRITNKDGKVTELNVPDGSKVTINDKGAVDVKLPGAKEKSAPVVQAAASPFAPIPLGQSPFDKLDPNAIPKEERFDWQPKELVAVIGKHERRSWFGHYSVAFSPDGSLAATGDNGPTVIWDVQTQTPKTVIPEVVWGPEYHPGTVSVSFLAGGKHVLCLRQANGANLQLWDISGKQPTMLPFGKVEKAGPFWGPWQYALPIENGNTVVALDFNSHLNLINLSGPKPDITVQPMTVGGPGRPSGGWAVAAKSSQVFYPAKDKKLHRATIKNSRIDSDEILPIPFDGESYVHAVTPDGSKLVITGKEMQVWDLSQQQPRISHRISAQPAVASESNTVISPDGKWLAAKNSSTALFRLDAPEPKLVAWLDQTDSAGWAGAVAFSPDGRKAIVANYNGLVRFWDLSGLGPKEVSPFDPAATFPTPYPSNYTAAPFDRVGGGLLLRRFDGQPNVSIRWQQWALAAKRPQPGPFLEATGAWFSGSGRDSWVQITNFGGDRPRQYRLADGKIQQIGEPFGPANVLGAASPDGRSFIMYTTAAPLTLECWDLTSPKPKQKWAVTPKDHTPFAFGSIGGGQVWFSADNRWFATQGKPDKDGSPWKLILWRNTTPTPEVHAMLPITWGGYRASFSPDGRYLAHTPNAPNEVVLLDLTGKSPREIGKVTDLEKINGDRANLSFHPDSKKLAVGSWAGVYILDVPTLKPVWYWKSPGPIAWLDWAADGRHLVTHNGNMTLYVLRFSQFGAVPNDDPERAAAELVLRKRGLVRIAGASSTMKEEPMGVWNLSIQDLPTGPFKLTGFQVGMLNDAEMAAFENLPWIRHAEIQRELTDAGLERLSKSRWAPDCSHLTLNGEALTGASLAHLKRFTKLKSLHLFNAGDLHAVAPDLPRLIHLSIGGPKITNAAIEHVKALTALTSLHVRGTSVTDVGIEKIRELRPSELRLDGSPGITNRAMEHLRGMAPGLTSLNLSNTSVGDAGLAALKDSWAKLRLLEISESKVTDEGLVHLLAAKKLVHLIADLRAITDRGLVAISKLQPLHWLSVKGSAISDAGLANLQRLPNLEGLSIESTAITDAGLEHLAALQKLKRLDLRGTKVTADAVKKLAAALPKCRIESDHGTFEPTAKTSGSPSQPSPWQPIPMGQSPFDKLDPNAIPKEERFPWQPKELVGIIGSHRGGLPPLNNHEPILFSPDGRWLVASSGGFGLFIWDAKTLVLQYRQSPTFGKPFFSADGKTMAVGTLNAAVDIIDLSGATPRKVRRRLGHVNSEAYGVALAPDAKTIVCGAFNGYLAVFDLSDDPKPRMVLRDQASGNKSFNIMMSPDGKRVGAICMERHDLKPGEGAIRFWDISEAKPRELFSIPFKNYALTAALSPDGKTLFVGTGNEGSIEAYDVTGEQPKRIARARVAPAGQEAIGVVSVLKDGGCRVLNADLELWRVVDGKLIKAKDFPKNTIAASDDQSRTIVGGERRGIYPGEMSLCDATGKLLVQGVRPVAYTLNDFCLPFLAEGRLVTTTLPYQSWEVKDGGWHVTQQGKRDPLRTKFAISPDEKRVAASIHLGISVLPPAELFSNKFDEFVKIPAIGWPAYCWGTDSKTLFAAQEDGSIDAWDITQKPPISRRIGKGNGPYQVLTASSDGRYRRLFKRRRSGDES